MGLFFCWIKRRKEEFHDCFPGTGRTRKQGNLQFSSPLSRIQEQGPRQRVLHWEPARWSNRVLCAGWAWKEAQRPRLSWEGGFSGPLRNWDFDIPTLPLVWGGPLPLFGEEESEAKSARYDHADPWQIMKRKQKFTNKISRTTCRTCVERETSFRGEEVLIAWELNTLTLDLKSLIQFLFLPLSSLWLWVGNLYSLNLSFLSVKWEIKIIPNSYVFFKI